MTAARHDSDATGEPQEIENYAALTALASAAAVRAGLAYRAATAATVPTDPVAVDPPDDARDSARQHRVVQAGWRSGWVALSIASVARAVLAVLGSLLLWSLLPAALGWHPTVVMSASMAPRLQPGDIVVSRPVPVTALRIGQVLLADDPDHPGRLRLHRLAKFRTDGTLTLRGDANPANDSSPVSRAAVHGVAALRVPYLGAPMFWLRTRAFTDLGLLVAAFAALMVAAGLSRAADDPEGPTDETDDSGVRPADGDATPSSGPGHRRGRHRIQSARRPGTAMLVTALLTAAVAGGGFAAAAPAHAAARFSRIATNAGDSWAATPYFTCQAAVLGASPFLYYAFGETSGNVSTDSSGNARNGTHQGFGTLAGRSGPCARDTTTAITLNGTSGYVSTPTLVTNPIVFTEEIWFKTTTTSGGKLIGFGSAQTGSSTSYDRHLYLTNTGQVVFGVYPNANKTVSSPKSYNDGAWHLADATLSAAGMQLYLDGQLVASDATVTTAQNYNGYWRIGYDNLAGWANTPTSYYLAATLAHAAVYTTALTGSQIAAHYNAA